MTKYISGSVFLFLFTVIFLAGKVTAGGCCYKSFSATHGIAGKQEASVTVSFVDPRSMGLGVGEIRDLAHEKILVHITSPKAGQSCKTSTETTNTNGAIEVGCVSNDIGSMSIYFSAPNLGEEMNKNAISSVAKQIYFDENPEGYVTPVTTITSTPNPTDVIQPTGVDTGGETLELKNKLTELEQKVAKQQEEVNSLKSLLDKIISFLRSFFGN